MQRQVGHHSTVSWLRLLSRLVLIVDHVEPACVCGFLGGYWAQSVADSLVRQSIGNLRNQVRRPSFTVIIAPESPHSPHLVALSIHALVRKASTESKAFNIGLFTLASSF